MRHRIQGVACGFTALVVGLVAGSTPPPQMSVAQWAEEKRKIAPESGSPLPGDWDNANAPHAVEPMEMLSAHDPCREVTFLASAQIAKTEIGVNVAGYYIDHEPSPILIVLASLDEASKFSKLKLAPTIDASPALRHKVRELVSRDETGSTVAQKKFRGGFLQITGANSPKGLQMISVRVLIRDEISDWPLDSGGRGDPMVLSERRTTAWSRTRKILNISAPGIAGLCRISKAYEAGDQRQRYVACPECGHYQVLTWENLRWRSETRPFGAHFRCLAKGCEIEHWHKRAMMQSAVWIKTYPEADQRPPLHFAPGELALWQRRTGDGREPSYTLWQAYSLFVDWDEIVKVWKEAEGNHFREKAFSQQVLARTWEEKGEAPEHEALLKRREPYARGRIPPGFFVLTGMADVQKDRIEWAVYAWGIGMTGILVDVGVVDGDPAAFETWQVFEEVLERRYEDHAGKTWPVDAFGVDSGFLSAWVYTFVRRQKRGGNERVFALDGRGGHMTAPIGAPRTIDYTWQGQKIRRGVQIWPTGTWSLKSWIYAALAKTIEGPDETGAWPMGCLRYPQWVDEDFFKQLTAEYLKEEEKRGALVKTWQKKPGQANEQLDIAVGARAMASKLGLDDYTLAQWQALAADRGAEQGDLQADMAAIWNNAPVAKRAESGAEAEAAAERARRLAALNG